jgi:hypothetical protein
VSEEKKKRRGRTFQRERGMKTARCWVSSLRGGQREDEREATRRRWRESSVAAEEERDAEEEERATDAGGELTGEAMAGQGRDGVLGYL